MSTVAHDSGISSPGEAPTLDLEQALAQTRALVEPLYADRTLRTGESFLAHADGIVSIVRPLRPDGDLLAAA
ncbi:MAG: hypothetical protein ACREBN_12785, partial [Burkholderiaceae bacterium]